MPIHDYKCNVCSYTWWEFIKITSDVSETLPCPRLKCGGVGIRQFSAPHTQKDFAQPIPMYSCAPTKKEDVDAFRRAFPDIQCEGNLASDMYGIPVVHNEQERSKVLRYFHFVMKEKPR